MRTNFKVLIVEDDQAIRDLIRSALLEEGYEVETAENGAALSLLKLAEATDTSPGLILLDMRMPVMDGPAFLQALPQSRLRPIPIVVMTAANDTAKDAKSMQADNYLSKPFDLLELFQLVEQYA